MIFGRRKKNMATREAEQLSTTEPGATAPDDARSIPEIVLISAPRSGTNFFCECLIDLPEVMGLYEIFNPGGVYGAARGEQLPILSELAGIPAESASDPDLIRLFRQRPAEALDALGETARRTGRSVVSYKVFPKQLDQAVFADLLVADHRVPVILTRNRLDVFISYEKARQSKTWKNSDTSGMKPTIDVDAFVEWARGNDDWFASCADMLDGFGKRFRMLSYATDVDVPKPDLLANLRATLVADGVDVSDPAKMPNERFIRQDVKAEPFAKIANGDELRAALLERDLLDYALGEPLADRQGTHGLVRAPHVGP